MNVIKLKALIFLGPFSLCQFIIFFSFSTMFKKCLMIFCLLFFCFMICRRYPGYGCSGYGIRVMEKSDNVIILSNTSSCPFNPERKIFSKIVFQRPFSNFLFSPEVDFQCRKCQVIITIKPDHMPFEFRKSVYYFSGYKQITFSRQNRKCIFSANIFLLSLRSNLKRCRLNFENPSSSSHFMNKKLFPVQTGS